MSVQRRPVMSKDFLHTAAPKKHRSTKPRLEVITGGLAKKQQSHKLKPTLRFAVTAMVALAVILGIQLSMSVLLAQGAYEITALQQELKEADRTVESVSEDIALLTSPQYLAAQAANLGMIPSKNVSFLRLSDGKIEGSLKQSAIAPIAQPTVKNQQLTNEQSSLAASLGIGAESLGAAYESEEQPAEEALNEATEPASNGLAAVIDQENAGSETLGQDGEQIPNSSVISKPENRGLSPVDGN